MDEQETARRDLAASEAPASGGPAPVLDISGIERHYGKAAALAGVELAVQPGEAVALLGPGGAGKTTLLKIVAGLARPNRGRVMLAGREITALPAARRNLGFVYRQTGLMRGTKFVAKRGIPPAQGLPRGAIRVKELSALALVGLSGHETREPRRLADDQRLLLALARAIAFDPALLLLDDCFGALERAPRARLLAEARRLYRRTGLAVLFATADRDQALLLADRIAAMQAGRIAQVGPPEELHRRPASRFVAELMGEANLFRGRAGVISGRGGGRMVEVKLDSGGTMCAMLPPADRSVHYGADLALVVRPDRPRRLAPGEEAENRATGTVRDAVYLGEAIRYRIALPGGGELLLHWPAAADRLAPGAAIEVGWAATDATAVLWA